jgi:hypothetical protein
LAEARRAERESARVLAMEEEAVRSCEAARAVGEVAPVAVVVLLLPEAAAAVRVEVATLRRLVAWEAAVRAAMGDSPTAPVLPAAEEAAAALPLAAAAAAVAAPAAALPRSVTAVESASAATAATSPLAA